LNPRTLVILALTIISGYATAASKSALSLPGYFGSINNNTPYVVECAQMIGGYCANNPMPANGFIQMLPDPGSKIMRGHLMIFSKNEPGKYLDNTVFTYAEAKDGHWDFKLHSDYGYVAINAVLPDTLLLTTKKAK
jgi:hypothetical protein